MTGILYNRLNQAFAGVFLPLRKLIISTKALYICIYIVNLNASLGQLGMTVLVVSETVLILTRRALGKSLFPLTSL